MKKARRVRGSPRPAENAAHRPWRARRGRAPDAADHRRADSTDRVPAVERQALRVRSHVAQYSRHARAWREGDGELR